MAGVHMFQGVISADMAYWLDEGWHSWPEVVRAGTAAAGLYARCGSYIADHTTDGAIPAEVVRMYGTAEWARKLCDVGLWTVEGDGYRDMRYFPLNQSREVIEKRKADAAERQRRKRRRNDEQTRESRVTTPVTTRVTSRPPSLPPKGGKEVGAVLPTPHAYTDDGSGTCSSCVLPQTNKIHTRKGKAA